MDQTPFDINHLQGLTEQEVQSRLAQDGYNELPSKEKRSFIHIILEVLREPMFLLLIACGGLYLLLGDLQEALMLVGFVVFIIGITIYQEQKTEKALDALRDADVVLWLVDASVKPADEDRFAARTQVGQGRFDVRSPLLPSRAVEIGDGRAMTGQQWSGNGEVVLMQIVREPAHFRRRASETMNQQHADRPTGEQEGCGSDGVGLGHRERTLSGL
jgi:hypothetical protein